MPASITFFTIATVLSNLLSGPINPHSVYHTGWMTLHPSLWCLYWNLLVQPLHAWFTWPSAMPYQTTKGESFHYLVSNDDVFYCCSLPVVIQDPYHTIPYQELRLLSIILSSMPLPSSLASLLETMLVYCPTYPLHKTKLIL